MMLTPINNSFEQDPHDVDAALEGPDLDFVYADADSYTNEIAELYSYTEFSEFQQNVKAFEDQMEMYELPPNWQKQNAAAQRSIVMKLVDQLEVSDRERRMQAARCILYLAQGCWAEVQSDEEQQKITRDNVIVLYELGVFSSFIELLNMEIESACSPDIVAIKVTNVTLADSIELRIMLSVLYIITETIRDEQEKGSEDYKQIAEAFVMELNSPLADGELLAVKLLGMITRFCSGTAPHFPMKRVVLLLWKVTLIGLGGMDTLKGLKNEYRIKAGLPPVAEDTVEVTRQMRASSPPATATDILDNQYPKRNLKRSLMKQRFLDEQEQIDMELTPGSENAASNGVLSNEEDIAQYYRQFADAASASTGAGNPTITSANPNNQPNEQQLPDPQPAPMTRLPWSLKVRQKDVDQFLDVSRNKFIGYSLIGDHDSLAGLPQPIQEGFKTLQRHMYVSLADIQVRKEEEIARNPISTREDEIQYTPAEALYQAILPNLPQYMIALLKILLAASPTSKSKTESINIMSDVMPKKMPIMATQSNKLTLDMGRHKSIIVKAVSAVLLLYLKHFKLNHVYQFEFVSQHLVFANCIPLVLKFFNQTITEYVGMNQSIPLLDFPSCVISEQPELAGEVFIHSEYLSDKPYCWRNLFSCINLLRVLNKLIKWKHSRVMMLVVFKSAPILKKTLKVRHAMMQLYVLKLLKMQTKYLGRQWRKSNMKTMSAIYSKVRHRLNDDWAFGNDLESRPWDFQAEECTLRACVDRFNLRRYPEPTQRCSSTGGGGGVNPANHVENAHANNMNAAVGATAVTGSLVANNADGNGGGFGSNHNAMIGNSTATQNIQTSDYGAEAGFPSDEILTHSDFAFFGHSGWWDRKVELTDYFKTNYAVWLEEEVYNNQTDWDAL